MATIADDETSWVPSVFFFFFVFSPLEIHARDQQKIVIYVCGDFVKFSGNKPDYWNSLQQQK